jgi:hypothetical protein
MAEEMADLRHMVAEAEAERDEAAEEVGRLSSELDRLQQEWASDSAEFKVLISSMLSQATLLETVLLHGNGMVVWTNSRASGVLSAARVAVSIVWLQQAPVPSCCRGACTQASSCRS